MKVKSESEVAQSCPTLCNHMNYSPPRSSVLGIFQARLLGWVFFAAAAAAKSLQSCPTLCNPIDGSPLGSPIPGILQARVLEWVIIAFSRGSSQPRYQIQVSCIAGRRFNLWATREAQNITLSPFFGRGWVARILEWVAIPFSRRPSRPRDWTQVSHIVGRCFTIWATREVKGI